MRAYNALPLDDDILDRIFAFLSDFDTLRALILTSKAFHSIFQAHPNSIIRAISYNLVGPALPQAVRYMRHQAKKSSEDDSDGSATEDSDEEDEEGTGTSKKQPPRPAPEPESSAIAPIKRSETSSLANNHTVVKKLEDIFSRKHKDRSFSSSALTSMESWRFRRATYRIMLFAELFPWSLYDDDDYDDAAVEQIIIQHRKFLEDFMTPELQELYSVALFLVELNQNLLSRTDPIGDHSYGVIALSCGPLATLSAFEDCDTDFWEELQDSNIPISDDDDRPSPVHDYLLRPLKKVMERRKATLRKPDDVEHWKNILDVIVGEHDPCQKCSASPGGFNLYNHKNWDTLAKVFDKFGLWGVRSLLKGNLTSNVGELANYNNVFTRPFDYHKFMEETFEFKRGTFNDWEKEDWLCESCVRSFITYHLHFWVLEKKKEAGTIIPEDCWYGYNCRTQTHSLHHAQTRNHFCEPT
ncbi:hypothetical protein BDN72DRAFT_834535, partial [Pluteus cervinus]